jgi:carbonic anhydrase
MNCTNRTSPVDIVKMNTTDCKLKCEYSFDYEVTGIRSFNKGNYILYNFDTQNNPPVVFNNEKYNVESMRLYQPSLHTFNGEKADAEILILHNNVMTNTHLIVCVPIKNNSSSESEMDKLINQTSQMANTKNTSAILTINNFSLKSIVPKKSFFSYLGTFPYVPCNGIVNYIVYDINNSLSIMNNSFINLQNIITENKINTITNDSGIFFNKDGPKKNNLEDDIYISCQPTGHNGDILISKTIDNNIIIDPKISKIILYIFLSIIALIVIYYIKNKIWSDISGILNSNNIDVSYDSQTGRYVN